MFIDRINSEKFTLGSHLINSFPLNLENGILKISLSSEDDIDIISNNKNYIDCLTDNFKDIFGLKTNFNFISKDSAETRQMAQKKIPSPIDNIAPLSPDDENPIIQAIINELGGKEIKKTDT